MDDLRSRIEQALGATHEFTRELGGGGMSRTYLATERALGREVVVTVLAPELLAGISVERFRREVMTAARLQHPHIVPVLTTGDVEGLPWFTMPYVEGESLRLRLGKGNLAVGEAVSILRDVARALGYAHERGIVHRDIKPDNVLLAAGSATVTDFGIAKAINAARAAGETQATLTQVGTSIGTPTYMAPEQAAGDADTDHRADIYAFGVMAYEMFAGHPPFQADSPARLVAAHLMEKPRDIRDLRPELNPALAEMVMACLAKNPGDRPQQARDIVRVLETVTTSGDFSHAPAILRGGRVRLARALAIWAAAAAAVIVTAWAATEVIGLPDWVLPGSIGVMLAGLPVIAFTAFVQRSAHRAFTATPTLTPGGTPAAAQGTLATLALKASPHVSWRRTWLGGSVAVIGFGVLVLGFMVSRAMGIGPAASLRGTGAFGETETLVVADFRSPPGDSTLGPTVAEALRTDLAQSSSFRVLTRASVREILRLMDRPAESAVPFEVAREIATREGAKAVLDGAVVRLGQSYVVSGRLVSALNGEELATFRETAESEDELMTALNGLSRAVREKAGESLRSIRASSELERVTTPSLPALRKYVEGSLLADEQGQTDRGIALLREAVQLDTAFAMAWRKLGVLLSNDELRRTEALGAISTAFRHRDRLTEMERFLTEGYYYTNGPDPDYDRALAAYTEAIRLDTLNTSALNNSAVIYGRRFENERARELYARVTRLPRTFGGAFTNLLQEQIRVGRPVAEMESTAAAFRARFPGSEQLWLADLMVAWGGRDLRATDSIAQAVASRATNARTAILAANWSAAMLRMQGRWREGQAWGARAGDARRRAEEGPAAAQMQVVDSAYSVALFDDPAKARPIVARALARYPMDSIRPAERDWWGLSYAAVAAEDPALARAALAGFVRDLAGEEPDSIGAHAAFAARVALAEHRWDDAIRLSTEANARFAMPPRELSLNAARAHDAAGRPDSAIAAYERFLGEPAPAPWQDAWDRAPTHLRLGELYEAKGDLRKATDQYAEFTRLWQNADQNLQPKVREARERMARLGARTG
ncbi:MAG TPA: protein kinase [Gemmatimonadales bacterium]|nr:protein kinase [Gemmatimonadales bacterium]